MPGRTPGNKPPGPKTPGEAPAARQALRDADEAWPARNRASDGIMGDASHQARPSDHNLGNAFDITHDPARGVDGWAIREAALRDQRTKYVIWSGRIWNPHAPYHDAIDGMGRPYSGSNSHHHHVHVSILEEHREDDRPWPWSPHFDPYA